MRYFHKLLPSVKSFSRNYWIGTAIILLATLIFFSPILIRINSYSEGGDAMFNAWTLARNHHCILRQNCPDYTDGNIYYPNNDTMLYSETQLSTGLLTLPLRLISENPVFYYNVWLVVGTFLNGWFMYLLAKRLSGGNEPYSVLAALVWEFGPIKANALAHMQNISILYVPLAILFIIKFIDAKRRWYLVGLFVTLVLLFYASWYQMVFGFAAIVVLLFVLFVTKVIKFRHLRPLVATIALALLTTLPLLISYVQFSKQNDANFSIGAQAYYAASVADYFIPNANTVAGKLYDTLAPESARRIPYGADGPSYQGVVVMILFTVLLGFLFFKKRNKVLKPVRPWLLAWSAVAVVGVVMSLGPLLKLGGGFSYATLDNGISLALPMPYLLLDFLLPQIMFIRAVERWNVITLMALAALIAYIPHIVRKHKYLKRHKKWVFGVVLALCMFELMPLTRMYMSTNPSAYDMKPPAVYRYIKDNPDIDNILILTANDEYQGSVGHGMARFEQVLWAGYHNKNIFNGYSGYEPLGYESDIAIFLALDNNALNRMYESKIHYILTDKELNHSNPEFLVKLERLANNIVYSDNRYSLYALPR